jgi:hypothetical protein
MIISEKSAKMSSEKAGFFFLDNRQRLRRTLLPVGDAEVEH